MTLQAHVWNLNVHPLPYPKGYEISPRKSQSVLEIIEPEDEVVDSIHSGNVPVQSIHPGPQPHLQGISTQRERVIWIRLRPIDNTSSAPLPQAPVT